MRCRPITILTSATLAVVAFTLAAPASAADRFCARWIRFTDLQRDKTTGVLTYGMPVVHCAKWVLLPDPPQPVPFSPLVHTWGWGSQPGDPSPWITEREFRTRGQANA